jgi:hypothetical protein
LDSAVSITRTRLGASRAVAAAVTVLFTCGLPACGPFGSEPQPSSPTGLLLWPAPSNPLELAVKAGLEPEKKESLTYHVHAHLDVFLDGTAVLVPAGIGINIQDPGVKKSDYQGTTAYGGIAGCSTPCISPLHTHDESGILHTESATPTPHRLGQFFIEWGVLLTNSCVGQFCEPAKSIHVYADGRLQTGDSRQIALTDHLEIAIVIGAAPARIPSAFPSG